LTTFADPSTFPSVFESPADSESAPAPSTPEATAETAPEVTAEAEESEAEETAAEETAAEETVAPVTFADFGLPAEFVRVLTRDGIRTPFEIQVATIPDALAGRDVLGRGQTGSGKTLAFGLPLLARVAQGGRA